MSKGFVTAEEGHVILLLEPRGTTVTVALTSDTFSMENWAHATILIAGGMGTGVTSVTVGECVGFGGTGRTALTFRYAKEATADGDVLDATLAWASAFTLAATAGVYAVIEIDADELTDGYPFIQVNFTAGATAGYKDLCAFGILSGGRFQEDITATAIA
jgi:hypothetical protein